jgi:hypothetical protein
MRSGVLVALVVALALGTALARYPSAFRELNNRAAHNAGLSESERRFEVLDRLGVPRAFVEASLRLPENATFIVETGPRGGTKPLARSALPAYLQNLLLPRRLDRERAAWVLCYGCDVAQLGGEVVWRDGNAAVVRRAR